MLRVSTTLVVLLAAIHCLIAQTGVVLDAGSQQPLEGATIFAVNGEDGTLTDEAGRFSLELTQFPDTLIVSYLGYEQEVIPLRRPDTYWEVRLERTSSLLPEIIVNSYRRPRQITEQHKSISDFLLVGEQLLLLTYYDKKPHFRLSITDHQGNIRHTRALEGRRPERLFRGCLGGLYLVYSTHLRELRLMDGSIELRDSLSIQTFRNTLKPCLYASEQHLYSAYYRHHQQLFQLFASARNGSGSELLETIVNEEVLRQIEDEERFLANKARTIVETNPQSSTRVKRMYADDRRFAAQVLYRPVRAQLFPFGDLLLLFDYTNHRIRWLDSNGNTHRETPIIFHRKNPYKVEVIRDAIHNRFYVLQADNKYTYLYEIDPRTGALSEVAAIPEIYLKRVQIRAGQLFYLHKGVTFEERWQYLYRVDLE